MRLRQLSVQALTLVLLAACGTADSQAAIDPDAVPEAERYGGIGVVGVWDVDAMLNPLTAQYEWARSIVRDILFLPLVRYDRHGNPVAALAERWDTVRVAPDTLELTFHLRRDVRWHDGVLTTADDLAFTFERLFDPRFGHPSAHDFARYRREAEPLDRHTVRFHLQAHPDFLEAFASLPIAPRHLLGQVAPEHIAIHPFGRRPVGNGPFRFLRHLTNSELVLEANPDFPSGLGGRPYLDRLVFREISEAIPTRAALMSGGIHVARAAQAEVDMFAPLPGFRIVETPKPSSVWIAWNTRLPLFQTAEVRRALGMALDRKSLGDLFGPGSIPGRSTVPPLHWSFAAEADAPAFDSASARRLLAAAGWLDRDGDGVLDDPAGRPFRFTLLATQRPGDATPHMVQAQLRGIGIDMQWEPLGSRALAARDGSWDAALLRSEERMRRDDAPLFHSRYADGTQNWPGFSHPRMDSLLDLMAVTMDRAAARPFWREYQRLQLEEAPVTVLFYHGPLHVVSRELQGVEPDAFSIFGSAPRWWIPPAERGRR